MKCTEDRKSQSGVKRAPRIVDETHSRYLHLHAGFLYNRICSSKSNSIFGKIIFNSHQNTSISHQDIFVRFWF